MVGFEYAAASQVDWRNVAAGAVVARGRRGRTDGDGERGRAESPRRGADAADRDRRGPRHRSHELRRRAADAGTPGSAVSQGERVSRGESAR